MFKVEQASWALFQTLSKVIEKQSDGVRAALALAMKVLKEHEVQSKTAAMHRSWHLVDIVDIKSLSEWVPVHRPSLY